MASGYRAVTIIPMIRNDAAIGALSVIRVAAGPLSEKERATLRTFASQAVIAIENMRLFEEVQKRTAELSEALEQQTATSEVLKVISRSAFDLQTVLDTLDGIGGAPVRGRHGGHHAAKRERRRLLSRDELQLSSCVPRLREDLSRLDEIVAAASAERLLEGVHRPSSRCSRRLRLHLWRGTENRGLPNRSRRAASSGGQAHRRDFPRPLVPCAPLPTSRSSLSPPLPIKP